MWKIAHLSKCFSMLSVIVLSRTFSLLLSSLALSHALNRFFHWFILISKSVPFLRRERECKNFRESVETLCVRALKNYIQVPCRNNHLLATLAATHGGAHGDEITARLAAAAAWLFAGCLSDSSNSVKEEGSRSFGVGNVIEAGMNDIVWPTFCPISSKKWLVLLI